MKEQNDRWQTSPALWEELKILADEKRRHPTEAESALWKRLRKHQVHGLSFRRQHCIGQFIVDFYCSRAKLVIEVDGPIHQYQQEKDLVKTGYLENRHLTVLRFSNEMVLKNIEKVMDVIEIQLPSIL